MTATQRQPVAAGNAPAAVPAPKVRRITRMRAMQALEHRNRIVQEGEVFEYFDFKGDKLPAEGIMVPCSDELGPAPEPPASKAPPPWTTKGFVERAHREEGIAP